MSTTPVYYKTNYNFSGTTTTTSPPSTDVGNSFVPVGTLLLYAGTTLPANYLWCDGAQVSTTTYSTLYSVIGNTYNINTPTSGNFFLPNLLSRIPIGSSNTSTMTITYQGNSVKSGGNKNMNSSQLVAHTHNVPSGNSYSYVTRSNTSTHNGMSTNDGGSLLYLDQDLPTTGGVNGTTGQDFLPPFTVVNYIIKYQ